MRKVLLKSRVGPVYFIHRPSPYERVRYDFSLDNDCRCAVEIEVWEKLKDAFFDQTQNLRYKEVFQEL